MIQINSRRSGPAIAVTANIFAALTGFLGAGVSVAQAQTEPSAWRIERTVAGGIAGLNQFLSVSSDGEIVAEDRRLAQRATAHAPDGLVSQIGQFVKTARKVDRPEKPMPDRIYADLVVHSGGREYHVVPPAEIDDRLEKTWENTLKQAVVGKWSQAGWKLCKPAAQLTAADIDPPIEELTFTVDGAFRVAWAGGARTTAIPHQTLPELHGRYTAFPESGGMSLSPDGGSPRDFTGKGTYQIDGNKLVLRDIWLGTRQAQHKPDICELTFARQ